MSNLQPLKWIDNVATAAGRSYTIHKTASGDYYTRIYNMMTQSSSDSAMYDTLEEVKHFAEFEHYIPKTTAEFLKPDMIGAYFDKFTQWGLDRSIIQNGNELAQGLKLVSEMGELTDNLAKGRCIKDDIGDCMVVLNMLANMTGVKIEDCLAQAWGDIKDRKGYMNEHGVFIKDGDSEVTND